MGLNEMIFIWIVGISVTLFAVDIVVATVKRAIELHKAEVKADRRKTRIARERVKQVMRQIRANQ